MAIAIVHKKQTGSGAVAALTEALGFVKPAAGNILAAFISQTATETAPTLAGYTVNPTNAQTTSSTSRIYFAIKEAAGTETEIKPTPGAGGAIQGISYVELSGATTEVDVIVAANKLGKSTNGTVQEITTAVAGDALLCGFGRGAGAFGALKPWAGEHKLTNVEEASTRCMSGYEVLTGTVTNAILEASWTTEANPCGLAVAIKPAGGAGEAVTVALNAAASTSSASLAVNAVTAVSPASAASTSSASLSATAATTVALAPASSTSSASASVTATTRVTLAAASSSSSATLAAHAVTLVTVAPASSVSAAVALVTVPTRVLLDPASSTSAASLTVGVPPTVALDPARSTSSASAAITSPIPAPPEPPTKVPEAGYVAVGRAGRLPSGTGRIATPASGRARR